jgi:hypothetical protein
MANFSSFSSKITSIVHNPKTKEMINKAKAAANKPENRAKIKQLQSKLTNRGRGHPGEHHPGSAGELGPDPGRDGNGSTGSGRSGSGF